MSYVPRVDAAATAEWPDLVDEFDRWGEAGRTAALWWRDDDAATATPQLSRLLRLAGRTPIGLAVIPALARCELTATLDSYPSVAVLQHGWCHANHAISGKKSEYPASRDTGIAAKEIVAGRDRLIALFGARALPVFVPPWNRFCPEFLPMLPAAGIFVLSAMTSTKPKTLPAALLAVDVHVDLVAWRNGRGFVGEPAALAALIRCLRAARLAPDPTAGPIGILTHHLVMDDAAAGFIDRLLTLVDRHTAARWARPSEFRSETRR